MRNLVIALLQRVTSADVTVERRVTGRIGAGLLAFVGVRPADDDASANRLLERILGYRVFADDAGRMNRSLADTGGGLLLVPQFTLAADTSAGMRPGFSTAAAPERARELYAYLLEAARARHSMVESGEFGAHMKVRLENDGPVTFWIESPTGT